jgi:hypothetical protein
MTDKRGTKILARTFFNQLKSGGYTPNQIVGIASELIELVTQELREGDKPVPQDPQAQTQLRQTA